MNRRIWLYLLACLACLSAQAQRMNELVREAETIAVVDAAPGRGAFDLTICEIVKGDPKLTGSTIHLSFRLVDPAWPGVMLLLGHDLQPTLTTYATSSDKEAVRGLVRIFELPDERQRIEALLDVLETHSAFRDQFDDDTNHMRERKNLSILLRLASGDNAWQVERTVYKLGWIGDRRAVPTLIAAMRSQYTEVALQAMRILEWLFPGAPGVREAFLQAEKNALLRSSAESYLARYDPVLRARLTPGLDTYRRFQQLMRKGHEASARPLLMQVLQDSKNAEKVIRQHADWLERRIRPRQRDAATLRRVLFPVLRECIRTGDPAQAVAVATVLKGFPREDAVEPLLLLLDKPMGMFDPSTRVAAYALIADGGAVRERALQKLQQRKDWSEVRPIVEIAGRPDEGAALLEQLREALPKSGFVLETPRAQWLFHRLGELREKRAIDPLSELLKHPDGNFDGAFEALVRIGGRRTRRITARLLDAPQPAVRAEALEILVSVRKHRLLPAIRRMVKRNLPGDRYNALKFIEQYGEPSDLKWLIPLSDYWTGDRDRHFELMNAVAAIRFDHGYDVRGKIRGAHSRTRIERETVP